MTQAGVILGTAAYMSPEQARGKAVDKRADIWAFGCVLYEMLSGRRLFKQDEVSDTLALVLTKDPDWGALPADTPPAIRRLLRRSLARDRHARLPDIGMARRRSMTLAQSLCPRPASAHRMPRPVRVQRGGFGSLWVQPRSSLSQRWSRGWLPGRSPPIVPSPVP